MCFKMSTPKIATSARELTPSTAAKEPEAPLFGDAEEKSTMARGKKALKIGLNDSSGVSRSSGLNF